MRVYGGMTGAGTRKVKQQSKKNWTCPSCGASNRYYWLNCPNDGHPRPDKED